MFSPWVVALLDLPRFPIACITRRFRGENSVPLINSFAFTSSWIGNLSLAPYRAFVVSSVLQVGKDSCITTPLHKRVIKEVYLELGLRTRNMETAMSQIFSCCCSPAVQTAELCMQAAVCQAGCCVRRPLNHSTANPQSR